MDKPERSWEETGRENGNRRFHALHIHTQVNEFWKKTWHKQVWLLEEGVKQGLVDSARSTFMSLTSKVAGFPEGKYRKVWKKQLCLASGRFPFHRIAMVLSGDRMWVQGLPSLKGGNPRPKTAPMSPSTGLLRIPSYRQKTNSLTNLDMRRSWTSSLEWLRDRK